MWSLAVADDDGAVWAVVTREPGRHAVVEIQADLESLRVHGSDDGLVDDMPLEVTAAGDGTVWIAGRSGVSQLTDDRWRLYTLGSDHTGATAIAPADDTVWIGLDGQVATRHHDTPGLARLHLDRIGR